MRRLLFTLFFVFTLVLTATGDVQAASPLRMEAITFSVEPGRMYVPLLEVVAVLRWRAGFDRFGKCSELNGFQLVAGSLRSLTDGTELIGSIELFRAGATLAPADEPFAVVVSSNRRQFVMSPGAQRVEISLGKQQLVAWQGARLVLQSRVQADTALFPRATSTGWPACGAP